MPAGGPVALQLRQNGVRQLLAQFHTPLVKGVDVPDHALGKYLVFVQRQQRTQNLRGQAAVEQAGAGPVAGKIL